MTPVRGVVIAVPARDEERLVAGCLASVAAARAALQVARPEVEVRTVVALDGCTDGTAAVARRAGAVTVELAGVGVGAARDAAVAAGLAALVLPDDQVWVACTDADSTVPTSWLVSQLVWADQGLDLVVGTVEPDHVENPAVLATWHARHQLGEGHDYVHGANLGVRASAWRAVGGFGDLRLHEDVTLVERIRAGGHRWVATDTARVRTSGRAANRVRDGFAGYLGGLVADTG